MKKLLFLIVAFCLSSTCATFALPMSQFEELSPKAQRGYLSGIASGIIFMDGFHRANGALPIYCMPDTIKFGGEMAKVALSNYRGDGGKPVTYRVIEGLRAMFPCK